MIKIARSNLTNQPDKVDPAKLSAGDLSSHKEAPALLAQAMALHRQGRLSEAQSLYEHLIRRQPRHAEALNFLGVLQQQWGQSTQAELLFRRSIHAAPAYASAYSHLGDVLVTQRRYAEATAAYRQAIILRPDEVDAYVGLGTLFKNLGQLAESLAAYRAASERQPSDPEIHYRIACLLEELGRSEEALTSVRTALESDGAHQGALMLIGTLLHRLGKREEAREILGNAVFQLGGTENALALLQHWLELMPDDPVAQHRLAAWFGRDVPERASDAYVTDLFDRYAEQFDQHLQKLGYRAPALLMARLVEKLGEGSGRFEVLDAGCGTGLCAPLLKPYARRLSGVDLSSRMIEKARERGGYDELTVAELAAFLTERPDRYDLIVSADTLVYFGDLTQVSGAAAAALRAGGCLGFTVERIEPENAPEGYYLNKSGRYSHTADYVRRILAATGLNDLSLTEVVLRQEGDQSVAGYVVLANKPNLHQVA